MTRTRTRQAQAQAGSGPAHEHHNGPVPLATSETHSWHILVLRGQNLRLLRPERAWRPIVTLDIDEHQSHEILLGVDGQNPNMKQSLILDDVGHASHVDVKVWHKPSTSKKSRKKKQLVASGKMGLGEIVKSQGGDRRSHAEVRLFRASSQGRKQSAQNQHAYPTLLIRVRPPPSIAQTLLSASTLSDAEDDHHSFSDGHDDHETDDSDSADHGSESPTNTEPTLVDIDPTSGSGSTPSSTIRRRRGRKMKPQLRGYFVDDEDGEHMGYGDEDDDDDEECSNYGEEEEVPIYDRDEGEDGAEKILPMDEEGIRKFNIKIRPYPPSRHCSRSRSRSRSRPRTKHTSPKPLHSHPDSHPHSHPAHPPPPPPHFLIRSVSYIATSILPTRYMTQDSTISAESSSTITAQSSISNITAQSANSAGSVAGSTRSVATSVMDSVTFWRELREAETDADLERTVGSLQSEWYYVGTLLLGVAGLDTAAFGFAPDAIFGQPDNMAKRAITISSLAAAIGLGMVSWFMLVYSRTNVARFQTLATDLYASYFFFSLSSRLPLFWLLISILGLIIFLASMAWQAWNEAALIMMVVAGVLVSLQGIVYGVHCCWGAVGRVGRGVGRGVRWVVTGGGRMGDARGDGEARGGRGGRGGGSAEAESAVIREPGEMAVTAVPSGSTAAPQPGL